MDSLPILNMQPVTADRVADFNRRALEEWARAIREYLIALEARVTALEP